MHKVIIFGYNFKHKKSENFLHILKKHSVEVVAYIAADSITLKLPEKLYKKNIPQYEIFHPKDLCENYNIPFFVASHNSDDAKSIIINSNATLGIVSGARILNDNIISLFKDGIINFHPGKIPEASGLDGLFWSIYKNISPIVTVHFIDKRVDAGMTILTKNIKVNQEDRIEDIKHKMSIAENVALEDLCITYLKTSKYIVSSVNDNYTTANKPMSMNNQKIVLKVFEKWKENIR